MILDPQRVRELTARTAPPVERVIVLRKRPTAEEAAWRKSTVRSARARREPVSSIARRLGISETAVKRHASDLPRGHKTPCRMTCPACHCTGFCEVIDSRGKAGVIIRRRECSCGARFSTVETVVD